jgi:hypothetical protein
MEVVQVALPQKRPFTFGDEFVPFKIIKTEHRADTSRAADLHGTLLFDNAYFIATIIIGINY